MRLTFVGDIHGRFSVLDKIAKMENSDAIIQVGDFGIWPGYYDHVHTDSKIPVYFCRGNHENHDVLETFIPCIISELSKPFMRIIPNSLIRESRDDFLNYSHDLCSIKFPNADNIFYCPDGAYKRFNDKLILFLGGAQSIDRGHRVEGISWWKNEILTYEEMDSIIDNIETFPKPDIIVSHTCPEFLLSKIVSNNYNDNDPTRKFLATIYEIIHPRLWYFGHFHIYKKIKIENTIFTALSCVDKSDDFDPGFYETIEI